jgi:hypothetical protein
LTRRAVLLLVLALLLLRGLLVVCAADVFGYGEEFAKGSVAKAMLDGLPTEHHRLCYGYPEGGGFAVAHLKAAFFLLCGESVLAHKLAALLLAALVLLALLRLASEHLSTRAALVFGALFVLAPSSFQRFSLLGLGTHFEACLFLALVLHFTLRLLRDEPARARDAWCLGLAGGFGLYFSLQLLPALAVSAGALLLRWRGRVLRPAAGRALAGFALGALPLWTMLALVGRAAVVIDRPANQGPGTPFLQALFGLVAPVARSRDPWTWAQAALLAGAFAAGLALQRTRAHALILAYLGLFALAWGASGLALEYDPAQPGAWFLQLRLAPLWTFGTLLACAGIAALWERGKSLRAPAALAFLVAALGGARDALALAAGGRPGAPLENVRVLQCTKGYQYPEYMFYLLGHLAGSDAEKAAVLLAYDDAPELLVPAVAKSVYEASGRAADAAVAEVPRVFGARAPLALLGLGRVVHGGWSYDVPAAFARLDAFPAEAREPLAEALGRAGLGPRFLERRLAEQLAIPVPERWRAAWLRGIGWRVHQVFRLRPDLAEAFLSARASDERALLRSGYDAARDADTLRSPSSPR